MTNRDDRPFIPGLDLSERFFVGIVKPLLEEYYPSLEYTACRLGYGSDVLGLDTNQSRDHDWGPKFDLLLENETLIDELNRFFQEHLREKFIDGYSTQFEPFVEENGHITLINVSRSSSQTCHAIRLMTLKEFFREYLNYPIEQIEPTIEDWLTFPSQHLLTITRGRVFHNSKHVDIQTIRSRLTFYPDEIWLYLIACIWQRIGQEEHLMGRAGQAEDELGSALIAHRLIRDIIRLIFLLEKQFYPYPKWLGTAFRRWTTYGLEFEPILRQVQLAKTWQEREEHLSTAYQRLATITREKLHIDIPTEIGQFHNRPFRVINGGSIAELIFTRISNTQIRQLPKIGSIDLFTDSTDAIDIELRLKMKKLFQ